MTTQSLTAEFAIEQLKILCQDGDVSDTFSDFEKSSDDEDEGVNEDDISNFVGILAKSNWESEEEFFKFYKFVGYELFTTASDPELSDPSGDKTLIRTSPHDIQFSPYTLTSIGGYFDLYARAREFLKQDQQNGQYAYEEVEIPPQCDAESEDITVIDLIPGATAYIYDHGSYLSGLSPLFDKLQVQFWCDLIYFLGAGYVESSYSYDNTFPKRDIALCLDNGVVLEHLFYRTEETNNDTYIYSQDCIDHLCTNQSTTSQILKTIALAATRNYEKLAAELEEEDIWHGSEDSFEKFREYIMEDLDWDTEEILEGVKSHPNCTDEILEIIAQYESENSDDDGEEDDL
jgi:hypothetical protein